MSEEIRTKIELELIEDMIFKCSMGNMKVKDCYIDETNQEEANMWGPNPVRLLGAAVLGCLSASLIFCLKKRNLSFDKFKSEAEVVVARNKEGRLQVKEINVKLKPESNNPDTLKRYKQCKKFFETFCTITQSVRAGIPVNVSYED